MVGYVPGKGDHMLQESPPWDDCFAGELQGTDKWLELNQTHFRKSGLHMSAIELNAHEFKNLGGAHGLGHDYRGMNWHEEAE